MTLLTKEPERDIPRKTRLWIEPDPATHSALQIAADRLGWTVAKVASAMLTLAITEQNMDGDGIVAALRARQEAEAERRWGKFYE